MAQQLTDSFLADPSLNVWNQDFIKQHLLAMSHGKCAYCETIIEEESKYLEVEHFRDKSDFPELVVEWSNLLPACKRCNGKKHAHNIETEGMIIDPTVDTPREHLYLNNFRLRPKTELGRSTVDVVYLNDTDRLVQRRFILGDRIARTLENLREQLELYVGGAATARRRNRVIGGFDALLRETQTTSEYSATAATCLLSDPHYVWAREQLVALNLWDAELQALHQAAEGITLHP